MNTELEFYKEPSLVFGNGQKAIHPRDGLTLFGPYDSKGIEKPKQICYGVVGLPEGVNAFKQFSERLERPILTEPDYDSRLWHHFPGMDAGFNVAWDSNPDFEESLDAKSLNAAVEHGDPYQRVYETVGLYMDKLEIAARRDDLFQVFICIVPDVVFKNCRMKSQVHNPATPKPNSREIRKRRQAGGDLFDFFDSRQYQFSLDFRRQLKARVMKLGIPVQIIRESTLRLTPSEKLSERGLTPLSDRAWNLATGLYYKAGGKPWKLSSAREGVCYVGIAFKDADEKKTNACCAAQMFLEDGDGVVFVGDYGPWYSRVNHQYHLPKESAQKLLAGILKTYEEQHGKPLKEIFLHCRSGLNDEELEGYQSACPEGVKLVAVRVAVERLGLRLYRPGTRPVLRGTFWAVSDKRGFLWSSGFKPRLGTYDGPDVPTPLVIDVRYGDVDVKTVAKDILALTKLNYNACKLGDDQPVTVKFSDNVGEILVANPGTEVKHPNFKFYI